MASSTPKKSTSSPPPISTRQESSPEVGSPSKITQYNKQTGRPVRRSAGKMKPVEGYVDSRILEEEDFIPYTSNDESEEEDDIGTPRGRANKTKCKRKRSPSPPSPRLDPIIYNQQLDELTDDETGGAFHRRTPKKPPVTLRFDVPLGYHGPLFVKLDPAILKLDDEATVHGMRQSKKSRSDASESQAGAVHQRRKGFTDLPPELRNKVYRYAFVRDKTFQIPACKPWGSGDLCQSGQFLSTCKLVHNEGCSILYGENTFAFERHESTRGTFYEHEPKEIGYQDALQFLKMIGPENIQYLRDLKIVFNDARPSDTPHAHSNEDRRYMTDDILINVLRILRHAKLRKLSLAFMGRRNLQRSDVKFLGYLEQIKTDELEKWAQPRSYYFEHKIRYSVWHDLTEQMVRKKKLYDTE
ncbi:hypothetical protein BU25DRAFT_407244 [Macroventuria anomochaeta]|uniref:Uncharacterized protein n=1 Tax=Macroventuria anomochaeta TaxID=301207 RepID=A0ACB6SE31_9PLEO|nr:uncharacterized protein BU25DRAFT_407244 [Macroventuria anomochaeta]KAF2631598.1 hypothetical protein BU25DRAFT_407244 [Macroventuria anomochaeta]